MTNICTAQLWFKDWIRSHYLIECTHTQKLRHILFHIRAQSWNDTAKDVQ